ncbi:sugar ABC transporter permease [Microbacterium barkeri]|uniref:Sugar ABC transporter permease n=1 Tax=Microbacterium barkeri TaxID=33917 RepID=A0A9W6H4V5_9MICO|nr:sugar ABC transporter permease [Microbacterium barkeri]MDI6944594.1 sugar ABC transporter permease [Microbacterium barkeri]MDR6877189.1 multiple sugar transport system permease protein [Microbacterium barkeri]GLJ62610.1 sugar ABC transporter permease [Microbacterium barkeri]
MATLTKRRGERLQPYLLSAPALVIVALLFLFPSIYNVVLAFQKLSPYDAPGDGEWVGLRNFQRVFSDPQFGGAAFNTVFWLTLVTVVLRLVFGLALSIALHSPVLRRWRLRGVARTMALIPWMVPPVVAVAAWKWILDGNSGVLNQTLQALGLIDAGVPFLAQTSTVWWCIAAIVVWRELPFAVMVLLAGLQSIPDEQYEAAALDGAGRWTSFVNVTLPNLRPVLTVVVLVTVIATFNNFVYVWLTTGGGPGTFTSVLATELYSTAFFANDLGGAAAIGLVMTAIMAVFAVIYMRVTAKEDS